MRKPSEFTPLKESVQETNGRIICRVNISTELSALRALLCGFGFEQGMLVYFFGLFFWLPNAPEST